MLFEITTMNKKEDWATTTAQGTYLFIEFGD